MNSLSSINIIGLCLKGSITPLMSAALYAEYEDVLNRDDIFKGSHLNQSERMELMNIFMASSSFTRVYFNWRPNLKDEGDNHLVELAIAGGASHIITKNIKDFVNSELLFPDIAIYSPYDFLEVIK